MMCTKNKTGSIGSHLVGRKIATAELVKTNSRFNFWREKKTQTIIALQFRHPGCVSHQFIETRNTDDAAGCGPRVSKPQEFIRNYDVKTTRNPFN